MLSRSTASWPPLGRVIAGIALLHGLSLLGCETPCPAESVINCGHRGHGISGPDNPYPENTIPAFKQAELVGAQMIELDVMHSADHELMVIHDYALGRTTPRPSDPCAPICIGNLKAAELRSLDAGFGSPLVGTGVTMPTLDEALAAIQIGINVEIKASSSPRSYPKMGCMDPSQFKERCPDADREKLAHDVVEALHRDPVDRDRVVISSFDLEVLLAVHRIDPSIHLNHLMRKRSDLHLAHALSKAGIDSLDLPSTPRILRRTQKITKAGLEANAWAVDDASTMKKLLGSGLSMLVTDRPDLLKETKDAWCTSYRAEYPQ